MLFRGGIQEDFDELIKERDVQARGLRFEIIVQRIFEQRRFRTRRNPPAALPRQTDLLATRAGEQYLIEVKWLGNPATCDDTSSLFDRLGRTPPDVVGVFFSMSGYTKPAVEDVEKRRTERPVLLFGPDEIQSLVRGTGNLVSLINSKKHVLTVEGRVLFTKGDGLWVGEPLPDRALLPQQERYILPPNQAKAQWFTCAGKLNGPVFACEVLNHVSPPYYGPGVALTFPLGIRSQRDLAYVFDALREAGWVTSAGWWSIRQESVEWHGSGPAALLEALEERAERYGLVKTKLHHSEQVIYVDVCEGRFYTLHAYIYVGQQETGTMREASISAYLPGIPVDSSAVRDLIHSLELDDLAYYRPLLKEEPSLIAQWDWGECRLEPIALICATDEHWVTGIIARNPFIDRASERDNDEDKTEIRRILRESEILICHLVNWHERGDEVDYYYLTNIEVATTDDAYIVEAGANWNDLVKRAHPPSSEE